MWKEKSRNITFLLIVLSRWNYIRLKYVVALYLQLWCGLYQENYWSTKVITINQQIKTINTVSEWLRKKMQHSDAKKKSDTTSYLKALLLKHGVLSPRRYQLLPFGRSRIWNSNARSHDSKMTPPLRINKLMGKETLPGTLGNCRNESKNPSIKSTEIARKKQVP